jgi:GxxExxY protein
MEGKILHKELSFVINGLLFETHNILGRYKNEKQYCDCLEELLKKKGLKFKRECVLEVSFNGEQLRRNICDFVIEGLIVLEIKTVDFLTKDHYFQVKRYLSSSGLNLGILVNFRQVRIIPKRILNNELILKNL